MDRLAAANLRLLSPVGSLRLAISASMSLIFSRFISSLLLYSSISSSKACVRETKKWHYLRLYNMTWLSRARDMRYSYPERAFARGVFERECVWEILREGARARERWRVGDIEKVREEGKEKAKEKEHERECKRESTNKGSVRERDRLWKSERGKERDWEYVETSSIWFLRACVLFEGVGVLGGRAGLLDTSWEGSGITEKDGSVCDLKLAHWLGREAL